MSKTIVYWDLAKQRQYVKVYNEQVFAWLHVHHKYSIGIAYTKYKVWPLIVVMWSIMYIRKSVKKKRYTFSLMYSADIRSLQGI